jgi:hypothetical protein
LFRNFAKSTFLDHSSNELGVSQAALIAVVDSPFSSFALVSVSLFVVVVLVIASLLDSGVFPFDDGGIGNSMFLFDV